MEGVETNSIPSPSPSPLPSPNEEPRTKNEERRAPTRPNTRYEIPRPPGMEGVETNSIPSPSPSPLPAPCLGRDGRACRSGAHRIRAGRCQAPSKSHRSTRSTHLRRCLAPTRPPAVDGWSPRLPAPRNLGERPGEMGAMKIEVRSFVLNPSSRPGPQCAPRRGCQARRFARNLRTHRCTMANRDARHLRGTRPLPYRVGSRSNVECRTY